MLAVGERVKFRSRPSGSQHYGTFIGGIGPRQVHVFVPGRLEHHIVHPRDVVVSPRKRTREQRLAAITQAHQHAGSSHTRAIYGDEAAERFRVSAEMAQRLIRNEGDDPDHLFEFEPIQLEHAPAPRRYDALIVEAWKTFADGTYDKAFDRARASGDRIAGKYDPANPHMEVRLDAAPGHAHVIHSWRGLDHQTTGRSRHLGRVERTGPTSWTAHPNAVGTMRPLARARREFPTQREAVNHVLRHHGLETQEKRHAPVPRAGGPRKRARPVDKVFNPETTHHGKLWHEGGCEALAYHVHRQTGWPMHHVNLRHLNGHDPNKGYEPHAVLRMPDGRLFDHNGARPWPEGLKSRKIQPATGRARANEFIKLTNETRTPGGGLYNPRTGRYDVGPSRDMTHEDLHHLAHHLLKSQHLAEGLAEAGPNGRPYAGWGPTGPDDAQMAAFTGVAVQSPEGVNSREDPIPARKASPSGGTEDPDPFNRDPEVSQYVSEAFRERLAREAQAIALEST